MRFVPALVLLAHVAVVSSAAAQPAKTQRLDFNGDPLPQGAVARLGTVRFQPSEYHCGVALSPDGTIVATATRGNKEGTRIGFMDIATGKSLRKLDLAGIAGEQMQFTPNGKSLVFTGWSAVTLSDAVSGKVTKLIDTFEPGPVAFTLDGKWVAAQPTDSGYHAPVGIWETTTGKKVVSLPGRGARCQELAFGPDGKRLLLRSIVPTYANGNGGMSFGPESKAALACIDVSTRKIVGDTTVSSSQQVALCQDGETVALEDADHQHVRIRHLPTGAERCVIAIRQAKFAFAQDGKTLVTIDSDGWAALWDAAKGEKIRDLDETLANKDFRILGISNDGKTIAVLDGGWHSAASVVVWNAATGKRAARPAGHNGTVTCLAYAPDGKLLASGSIDQTVRLWNPATGEHLRELAVHSGAITAIAFSADGKLLASSSQNGSTRVFHAADGKVVAEFAGPDKGATALAFSPDGTVLFAGGRSPEVKAWEIATGKERIRLSTGQDGFVMAIADGGALALTANGEIRLEETPERLQVWNPSNKLPLVSIPIQDDQRGNVRCDAAIFSPDGRMFASSQISEYQGIRPSYGAARLRLWERASGEPIATLSPTITRVLAFSRTGRFLASGGAGRSGHLQIGYGSGIDVWDAFTGKKAGSLAVTPECLAFSPDGSHLATGGRDHCVVIYETPGIQTAEKVNAPSAAQRDAWWKALGSPAKDAYNAIGQMIDAPEHAVALLKERVQPVQRSDPATVAKLITQLDSDTYAEREKAQIALEKMGEGAAHLFKQSLEGKINVELRRRLEALLRQCDKTSIAGLRHHRAVATLEWIATGDARVLLRTLADGAPDAHVTVEAHAALKRLQR